MVRQRSAAIIIQDKKILLVRDDLASFFSMPGGMVDEGEDRESALAREVEEEEIGVPRVKATYFSSFDHTNLTFNVPQTDHAYLVTISDPPLCSHEICELGWFTKDEILSKKIEVPPVFLSDLVPKLIKENLL